MFFSIKSQFFICRIRCVDVSIFRRFGVLTFRCFVLKFLLLTEKLSKTENFVYFNKICPADMGRINR